MCKQYFADKELVNPNLAYAPIILGTDNPQCQIPEVQSSGALFIMVMSLCTGILSIFIAPKMGQLSDRYGRTKLMALASCGGLVAEVITILAAKFPDIVDYRWLILGSVCDGLTGSFTAGSILSQAYTSDCTAPSKRAVSIGYIHACLFGGLAIGPLLAGYIVKWTGSLITIFYIVMGCHLFFIFCVGFVIPESLSKQRRLIAREKHEKELELYRQDGTWLGTAKAANPLEPLKVLWPSGHGTSTQLRINLVVLAFVDFVIMGCMVSAGPVIMLYTRFQFHWGTFETSNFISSLSMVRVVVLMGIFPIINYIFRIRPRNRQIRLTGVVLPDTNSGADNLDIWILRVALLSDIIGSVGYIFARSEALFYLSGMMTAVGGLGSATVQAVVTKHVPADRVGGVLGAIGMLHASTRVVGPLVFNGLYAKTVGHFTQAIFVLLVSIFTLGLVSSLAVRPRGMSRRTVILLRSTIGHLVATFGQCVASTDSRHSILERGQATEWRRGGDD